MIGLRTLILFYRRHLRIQPLRELMAVTAIAAGVALFFAVQVAKSSVTGAFDEAIHGIAGRATVEVAARSPEGFDESIGEQIARVPGVKTIAPILAQQVILQGPKGTRAITLVGSDERLASFDGKLVLRFQRYAEMSSQGSLIATDAIARAIGANEGRMVAVKIGERTEHLVLGATVPAEKLGPLADSPIAATSLRVVQALAALPNRVTRILVEPVTGKQSRVRRALVRRFGAILNVRSVDAEDRLLSDAATPEEQLTSLFSAISLAVGVILAYNALLLASDERQAFVTHLVQLGTPNMVIVASLAFEALILGVVGSLLGLLAGDVVSLLAHRAPPGYLTAGFSLGDQRIVSLQTILISFTAGVLAAFAAATFPAAALLRRSTFDPDATNPTRLLVYSPDPGKMLAFLGGALLVCASVVASLIWTIAMVAALVMLTAGIVLCLPMIVHYALKLARIASRHISDPSVRLASGELLTSPARSMALGATGVITALLMVTIGGTVADVQRAVHAGAQQAGSNADLWIRPDGAENVYGTQPFADAKIQYDLRRLGVVRSVLAYRGSFLDLADRRLWVIGVPPQIRSPIAESQIVKGVPGIAIQHLRESGWAAVSQTIASQRNLHLDERFTLSTPSGSSSLRLAATISNYGWPPGTILLNANDYSRLWHTSRASELAITLNAGVSLDRGKLAIQRALPRDSALTVQTAQERQSQVTAVLSNPLSRLDQTTTVVLAAVIITVIAMMVSAVSQRRERLDALLSIGMSFGQLARLVFYESGSVLLGGCVTGAASGILGQYLVDNWLRHSTGSPIVFGAAWPLGLRTILIAIAISVTVVAIAAPRAVRFRPRATSLVE